MCQTCFMLKNSFIFQIKMSVILITSHNENIYDTSKIKSTTEKQPLIYKSKFSGMKKPSSIESKNYKQHATMGLPHMPLPNPTEFLKRNTWKPPINPCTQEEHDQCHSQNTRNNPLVPNRDEVLKEQDAKLKHTKKDYITKNVKAAVRTKPKEPVPKVVLDRYGSKKELKAGLEPRFIFSEVFGRTPRYLQNIIKLKEQQIQEDKDKLSFQQPKCRYITREERDNLLTVRKSFVS